MDRLNWVYEIKDYEKHIEQLVADNDDMALLYEILKRKSGSEAFVNIVSTFLKTNIKIIEKPFNDLKKIYVLQNKNEPVSKLARKLDVDERTIYSWLSEMGIKRNAGTKDGATIEMFEEE